MKEFKETFLADKPEYVVMEMPKKNKKLFSRGQFLASVVNLPLIFFLPLYSELYLKPADLMLKYFLAYTLDGLLMGNLFLVMSLF